MTEAQEGGVQKTGVWGFGGLGLLGFRGFWVWGLGFRVSGLRGLGFRVFPSMRTAPGPRKPKLKKTCTSGHGSHAGGCVAESSDSLASSLSTCRG